MLHNTVGDALDSIIKLSVLVAFHQIAVGIHIQRSTGVGVFLGNGVKQALRDASCKAPEALFGILVIGAEVIKLGAFVSVGHLL